MTHFEVGKFYRVIGNGTESLCEDNIWHSFDIGEIVKMIMICHEDHLYVNSEGHYQYVEDEHVELTDLTDFPQ